MDLARPAMAAMLAPDDAALLAGNDLVSAVLGARKPERRIYTRALGRFGVTGENAIMIDDSAANLVGAATTGMHTFQLQRRSAPGEPAEHNTVELMDALRAFASR
ncbi:MAG: HAD-IA family hydrolase [Microterricola sp.]